MNHIPRPTNAEPSLEFTYYHGASWDHGVKDHKFWLDYQTIRDWSMPELISDDYEDLDSFLRGRPFNDLAVFLQSWYYFGTLAICTGSTDVSVLIAHNIAGEPILDTTRLLPLVQTWYDKTLCRHLASVNPHDSYSEQYSKCMTVIDSAETYANLLVGAGDTFPEPRGVALTRIGISTLLLLSTLRHANHTMRRALNGTHLTVDPLDCPGMLFGPPGLELNHRLVQSGWCPAIISSMTQTIGLEALIMASMIHKDAKLAASHSRCTKEECVAHQIQTGRYTPKHANEFHNEGSCEGIKLPSGTAEWCLLHTDSFPVVRLWVDKSGVKSRRRRIEATPFRTGLRYVAISHVWSDGMGDEKGNSIMSCQYDRLRVVLSEVMDQELIESDKDSGSGGSWSPYFWLDTICVPHDHGTRRLAISRMSSSYKCAHTVLVFDAELQAWSYKGGSDEEALLRISTSGWVTRVWTLSEAVLANRLVFKFADTIFNYASCGDRLRFRQRNGIGRFETLPLALYSSLKKMQNIKGLHGARQLITAMQLTMPRRTSHPGDEIVSLGVLIKMDGIGKIYDQPTWAKKMIQFLEMVPELPRGLLFSCGPKLKEPGFRWAPASLKDWYSSPKYGLSRDTAALDRKEGGLLVSLQGILLYGDWSSLVFKDVYSSDTPRYRQGPYSFHALYRQNPSENDLQFDPKYEDWCSIQSVDGWQPWEDGKYLSLEQLCEREVERTSTALAVIIDAPSFFEDEQGTELRLAGGVLVSNVVTESNGVISCRYQCRVRFQKYWRKPGPMSRERELLHHGLPGEVIDISGHIDQVKLGTCSITKESQVWRVT